MNTAKKEARELIERLPDSASWDDIMYELHVRQKISAGLRAEKESHTVSRKEAKRRLLNQ